MANYKRYEFKGGYRKVPKEVVHAALRYTKELSALDLRVLFIILRLRTKKQPNIKLSIARKLLNNHRKADTTKAAATKLIPILAEYETSEFFEKIPLGAIRYGHNYGNRTSMLLLLLCMQNTNRTREYQIELPNQEEIAKQIGVSISQVRRAFKDLERRIIKPVTKKTQRGADYAWKAVIDLDPQNMDLTEELQSVYDAMKNRIVN